MVTAIAVIDGKRVQVPLKGIAENRVDAELVAEQVFDRLNHGSGLELEGYTGRSLSVGDMVEVPYSNGGQVAVLRCAGSGWEILSHKTPNPEVVRFEKGYGIRFVRSSWKVLVWIQDLTKRSMKSEVVNRPLVTFSTRDEAEAEVRKTVIPHLLNEKDVAPDEVVGW